MDLIADHISHRFGALDVLDNVSFKVGSGEVVAIVGPSAAARARCCRSWAGCCSRAKGRPNCAARRRQTVSTR